MSSSQAFRIVLDRNDATRQSCRDVACAAERDGWVTVLDPSTEKHRAAIRWIKGDQGRRYIELRSDDALDYVERNGVKAGFTGDVEKLKGILRRTPAGMVVFIFAPGQQCFRPHLDREVRLVHDAGAHKIVHAAPRDFTEDFNQEADRVNRMIQRG